MKDFLSKIRRFDGDPANAKYKYALFGVLIALLVAFPLLGASQYMLRVSGNIFIYAMLALSLNIITGYAGQVSMGHAAFMAVGAYTYASLTSRLGWAFLPALLAAMAVSGLAGLLLGAPTLRLSGAYFVVATTGFSEVVKVVAQNWKSVTNGTLGIKSIHRPSLFGAQLTNANGGIYWFILFWLALTIFVCYAIKKSKMGRALFAIKDDPLAARYMGINTSREKVIAFVIASVIAGVAGVFYSILTSFIEPRTFTADMSTVILCVVIFGGMGSIPGMLVGAVLLILFPEALRALSTYRFIVYGIILIVMMRFRSQGMLGGLSSKPYKLPRGVALERKGGDN